MADRLVAWLHDTPVAVLIRGPEFRIRLEWRPEGIERWGLGSRALSVGLPIGAPAGPRDMRGLDFFENLLPEGPALERMAALARVRPADTYGILAAFGRDCAGAIMVLPNGDRPGGNAGSGYSPMTPGDLQRVIGALDVVPLGAAPERGFRPSLAGFQRKALLGLPVLAVKRYDRQDSPAGGIPARVHQEDGCQATATPPGLKDEEQGGPALRDLADVIRNFGDPRDVTHLLRRTTFNMAVGNADAHAKNFSVLHEPDGPAVRLAPLGLTSRPAAIVTVPRALSRLCATGERARPASHAAWRRPQPAAAR